MRRWRPGGAFVIVLLGIAGPAPAGIAGETPLTAFQAAVQNNAGFLAARAGLGAEREAPRIAFSQLLPNVSFSGSGNRNDVDRGTERQTDRFQYDSYTYSLNLRQPIYRRFNLAAYEQSAAQVDAAEAMFIQARGELALRSLSAYLDAVFSDDVARLLQAQKAAVTAQADAAQKSFAAGSGTRIDVDEARSRLDLIQAQEIEVRHQQENARRVLQALIARPPAGLAALQAARMELVAPRPAAIEDWVAEAEARNPELSAARHRVTMAEQEVEKAASGHHPTLDLVASTGKSSNNDLSTLNNASDVRYRQSVIGLQLNLPIFAGGQVNATVEQARSKLAQAGYLAQDIRNNLGVQLRREFSNVVQGVAKVRALERAEASAQQTFESSRKGVAAGLRSTLDVLLADQQLFTVRRDLARERYQYLIARVRLAVLAGRDAEADLTLLSAWFADS